MVVIPKLGELKPDRDVPEWWVSEPIPVSFFAGTALAFIIDTDADAPDVHAAVALVLSLGEADGRVRDMKAERDALAYA